jgi:C-terminal processing protease CtpA/Prc
VYWQKSTADDPRITIEPDLAVPYSSDDYFNDRDPQLEAAIRVPVGR